MYTLVQVKLVIIEESSKLGVKVTTLVIEQPLDSQDLQMDLSRLADLALPTELCTYVSSLQVACYLFNISILSLLIDVI